MLIARRKFLKLAAPALLLPRTAFAESPPIALPRSPFILPLRAPGVDPSHPASQNLLISTVALATNNDHINLFGGGAPASIAGAPTGLIDPQIGPGVAFNNAADRNNFGSFPVTTTGVVATSAAIFKLTSFNPNGPADICGDSNTTGQGGLALSIDTSGGEFCVRFNGNFWDSGGFFPFPNAGFQNVGAFYCVSVNANIPGAGGAGYITARLANFQTGQVWASNVWNSAATGSNVSTGTFTIGGRDAVDTASRNIDGIVAATMRSNSFLTDAILDAWVQDPWSFWYPN